MPKHKLESIAQAQPPPLAASSHLFEHNMQQDREPPIKRRRAPHLNFSIESMMQPEQQQQQQKQIFGANIKQRAGVLSRSPSPGLSEAGSASSGSTGTLTESQPRFERHRENNNNSNNNVNHLKNDTESLSSSQSSSRISSPISPGWNQQQQQQQHTQHHHHNHHHFGHLTQTNALTKGLGGHHNHHLQQQQQQQQQQAGSSSSSSSASYPTGAQHRASLVSKATTVASSCAPNSSLNQVDCVLDNKDMWDKFHSLNTEMIITKTGRRMFPVLKVQFLNLDPNARYAVSMSIVPVDNKRYRYAYHKSCWQVAGKADPSAEPRIYPHPDSPFNGDLLARQVISFEKVKLTNNEMDKSGHIILNSMHKYQPQVHLIKLKSHPPPVGSASSQAGQIGSPLTSGGGKLPSTRQIQQQQQQQFQQQPQLEMEDYRTFVFSETVFTAVTAYQNQLITKMKIDKNPFAKGFRDSSRLSDLDRNDPFDYMGALGPAAAAAAAAAACAAGRGFGPPPGPLGSAGPNGSGGQPFPPGFLEAAGLPPGGPAHNHPHNQGQMDQAYAQLLAASAAATQSPWYPAGPGAPSPFGAAASMGAAAACSTAQAAQHLQTQLWLAAFTACLNNGGQQPNPPTPLIGQPTPPPPLPPGMHHHSNISSPTAELATPTTTTNLERRGDSRSSG